MQLVEIDVIATQAPQGAFDCGPQTDQIKGQPAIAYPLQAARRAGGLGRQDHLLARLRREPVADDLFASATGLRPRRHRIHFGRVDEVDSGGKGTVKLGMRFARAVLLPEGHRAKADLRHLQGAVAQGPSFHASSSVWTPTPDRCRTPGIVVYNRHSDLPAEARPPNGHGQISHAGQAERRPLRSPPARGRGEIRQSLLRLSWPAPATIHELRTPTSPGRQRISSQRSWLTEIPWIMKAMTVSLPHRAHAGVHAGIARGARSMLREFPLSLPDASPASGRREVRQSLARLAW